MNRLNNAPMSAASITLMPTQRPASMSRIQRVDARVSGVLAMMSASAKKSMLNAISWDPTPQQALVKNVEFNMAASAPSPAESDDSFRARKKVQAASPTKKRVMGGKNFAYDNGPINRFKKELKVNGQTPPAPMVLVSPHIPMNA